MLIFLNDVHFFNKGKEIPKKRIRVLKMKKKNSFKTYGMKVKKKMTISFSLDSI